MVGSIVLPPFNLDGIGTREARKVFSQVFFKKLVGFGVKPQDLTGVRGVLVPGGHRSGPVYVATSVGAGRLPLADSTRAGRRDWRLNAAPVRTANARARRGQVALSVMPKA